MNTVIAFRGRSTERIIQNARSCNILRNGDRLIIVCRNDDQLRIAGDVPVSRFEPPDGNVILIANGGTTAQTVPVVLAVAGKSRKYKILDLQFDGIATLAEQREPSLREQELTVSRS